MPWGPFGQLPNQRRGDFAQHNGTDWEVLHPGTSGQFLQTLGAGARAAWASATAVAHNLLSATHSDTLAGSVTDGDVIIGNVTPKWSRLGITVPAANILEVLGVVNGELRPSWKAVHDGTAPANVNPAIAAAAGTSLISAHRDHIHPLVFDGARAYNSGNVSINDSTQTALTFDSERYDTNSYHSTSSFTSRLTAPATGYYHIGCSILWDSNAVGNRLLILEVNGTTLIAETGWGVAAGDQRQALSCDYKLTAADYVEVQVFQNSGGTRTVNASGNYSPEFWMHLIGV